MTPRTPRLVVCFLGLALATAAPVGPVAADDDAAEVDRDLERAKKLFYQGRKLFDLRRFERALAKFEAAFEAKPIPDFLFNIGQCHRNLGNYDEAIFSFRRYLKLDPDAERRPEIEELIEELEEERTLAAEKRRPIPLVPEPKPTASSPIYKRWWFWTGLVAVAAGTTAVLVTRDDGGLPGTDLGNLDFGK